MSIQTTKSLKDEVVGLEKSTTMDYITGIVNGKTVQISTADAAKVLGELIVPSYKYFKATLQANEIISLPNWNNGIFIIQNASATYSSNVYVISGASSLYLATLSAPDANISFTKDTANKINIYRETNQGALMIQSKLSSSVSITLRLI